MGFFHYNYLFSQMFKYLNHCYYDAKSSLESQKGVIIAQICAIEKYKGAIGL